MSEDLHKSLEESDPYWRLYAFTEGRVLSAEDVRDIQQVLSDYNDEIGSNCDLYHKAREQVLREIGGDEIVALAARADGLSSAAVVEKALAHFRAQCAKYEGSPTPYSDTGGEK